MLINFAYEGLLKIECDCLQHDGHSIGNLINRDSSIRAKGFLADRFIKPPANILLLFTCDVDISKIVLNPRVGSQRSAGFEISKVLRNKSTISIAQVVIKDGVERVVFSRDTPEDNAESVRFCSETAASRVRELKLRIFKTSGSTLPALGGLEIWGKPSPFVPNRIKGCVRAMWKDISCSSHQTKRIERREPALESSLSSARTIPPAVQVPEEFLDPICCEVMTIPMTLPSGNIVDISTLEKFFEAESKLGRGHSDPFTGVLFTERNKPVVATSLKGRLDKFLLENCDAPTIKLLPRTIGRKFGGPSVDMNCSTPISSDQTTTLRPQNVRTVDDLLANCLQGLPSYMEPSEPPFKKSMSGCSMCLKSASTSNSSYTFKLPCHHVVCRGCLCLMRQNNDSTCSECRETFDFANVERWHM